MSKLTIAFSIILAALLASSDSYSAPKSHGIHDEIPTLGPTIHKMQIDCDSSKLLAISETVSSGSPIFSAVFFTLHGGTMSTIDLTDQFRDLISENYDIKGIELGCLEEKHGHGIKVPNRNPVAEPLHIQITTEGRVFEGYDHAGYHMLGGKKLVQ